MIESIQNKEGIAAAQVSLVKKLKAYHYKTVNSVIGYPGGNYETDVYWLTDLGFWCCFETILRSRYWNAFGLTEPKPKANLSITCEINFPLSGTNKRIGAVYAKDDYGATVIVHRGKIGGGRKGIGKSLFLDSYRGEWETLSENGYQSSVALIASLSSSRLGQQMQAFILEVERIKNTVGQQHIASVRSAFKAQFSEEFAGKKEYAVTSYVEAKCDHGLIVKALADLFSEKSILFGNDRNRDLFIVDSNGDIQSLFEVKTDLSSQSIYSAIGQLYFNSTGLREQPNLFMVLPEMPSEAIVDALSTLSIKVLIYKLDTGNVLLPPVKDFL